MLRISVLRSHELTVPATHPNRIKDPLDQTVSAMRATHGVVGHCGLWVVMAAKDATVPGLVTAASRKAPTELELSWFH